MVVKIYFSYSLTCNWKLCQMARISSIAKITLFIYPKKIVISNTQRCIKMHLRSETGGLRFKSLTSLLRSIHSCAMKYFLTSRWNCVHIWNIWLITWTVSNLFFSSFSMLAWKRFLNLSINWLRYANSFSAAQMLFLYIRLH